MIVEIVARLPSGASVRRTRCTRRSLDVTVPSLSNAAAAAGNTTSAICRRAGQKQVLHDEAVEAFEQMRRARLVGLRLHRVLADHVERAQLAALHRLEHPRQVPAPSRRDRHAPRPLELRPHLVVLDVLETRQPIGQRAHVAAALHVVLAAQRVDARSPACRRDR